MAVLMETSLGDLEIDLYVDECPSECLNFLKLCKCKYYNFSLFHRVIPGFIAQAGDPSGSGKGGCCVRGLIKGEAFQYMEKPNSNRLKHARRGTLSMVCDANGRFGSQFFVTLEENLSSLDGKHAVFGEVAEESYEVLEKMTQAICDGENRPYRDIRIRHTIVLDDPFDDPEGLPVPDRSPLPTKEQIEAGRIGDDEAINEFEGMSEDQVEEIMKKREARGRAQILEMVGDLPDADVKPPENILFVCKLNPVTSDEDLKLIFSRFGKVNSCEIVRDFKTGESLQYAFIEFEREEECEEAYFKMDNVLIDERRIKVDFSQSVAKMNKYSLPKGWNVGEGKRGGKLALKGQRGREDKSYQLVFDEDARDSGPAARGGNTRGRDDRHDRSRQPAPDRGGRSHHDRDRRGDDRRHERERDGGRREHGRERERDRDQDRDRGRERERDRDQGRSREHSRGGGHSRDDDRRHNDDRRRDDERSRGGSGRGSSDHQRGGSTSGGERRSRWN